MKDTYEPFGEDWKKEMNKFSKVSLSNNFGITYVGKSKAAMIEEIKSKLMNNK